MSVANDCEDAEQVSLLNAQDLVLSDPSMTRLIKQPADQIDIPQKFNAAGVYQLPFSSSSRALNYAISGWDLNWNVTYMKGWAALYPNAAQVRPGSAKLSDPTVRPVVRYFAVERSCHADAWSTQEPFTLRTFPLRFSDVRLPGYQNWDVSISVLPDPRAGPNAVPLRGRECVQSSLVHRPGIC